jgi:hypothetical protein
MTGWEPDNCHEKIKVHRVADRVCAEASGDRRSGSGSVSQAGNQRSHFLQLEEEVRRVGDCELRRLRQLEEENAQLKRIVADLTLDKQMLQDVLKKNL